MRSAARSPYTVAALVTVTGAATSVHLAVSPDPFAPSSVLVIVLGIVIFTVITVTGLLLARGRWSRRLGVALVASQLGLIIATSVGMAGAVAVIAGIGAIVGLLGRWLDGWVRPRPSATGPDPNAVLIMLGLIAIVPAVGVASPSGLETAHGILGAAGVLLAWSYSQGHVWSLWAVRVILLPLAVGAAVVSPAWGGLLLVALTGCVVAIAWTRTALLSVQPLPDTLPVPHRPSPTPPGSTRSRSGPPQSGTGRTGKGIEQQP